jgi:hypothetical protein
MKNKQQVNVVHKDGYVQVPLINSDLMATVDEQDFKDLLAREVSPRWRLGENKKVYATRNRIVARLIMGAGKKRIVKYVDGDRTNLRRSNLTLANYTSPIFNLEHTYQDNRDHTGDVEMSA